jgi:hypothetical protein
MQKVTCWAKHGITFNARYVLRYPITTMMLFPGTQKSTRGQHSSERGSGLDTMPVGGFVWLHATTAVASGVSPYADDHDKELPTFCQRK